MCIFQSYTYRSAFLLPAADHLFMCFSFFVCAPKWCLHSGQKEPTNADMTSNYLQLHQCDLILAIFGVCVCVCVVINSLIFV